MEIAKETSRFQKNKRKQRLYRVIFLLVLLWFIGSSIIKLLLGLFITTQFSQFGVIERTHELNGYILRDEVVIIAPATGKIKNKITPGERVSRDSEILQLEIATGTVLQTGDTLKINAPKAGVVSYVLDGLEQFFRPNMLEELDIRKIEKLTAQYVDNSTADVVEKGNGLCKIVNNLEGAQIYLEFPLELFKEPLQKGQRLTIKFPQLGREISAPIIDLKGYGNTAQVLVSLPEMWYGLINIRTIPIELVLDKQEGTLISKRAVVEKETGEKGVFWLRKGFVFWQEVQIIAEKGEELIIEGIEPLTEIILTPKLVKEGQHIGGGFFGYSR